MIVLCNTYRSVKTLKTNEFSNEWITKRFIFTQKLTTFIMKRVLFFEAFHPDKSRLIIIFKKIRLIIYITYLVAVKFINIFEKLCLLFVPPVLLLLLLFLLPLFLVLLMFLLLLLLFFCFFFLLLLVFLASGILFALGMKADFKRIISLKQFLFSCKEILPKKSSFYTCTYRQFIHYYYKI